MGKKVLLFLDEADALLASRSGGIQSHSEDRKILETIMKNLQIAHDTPNFYVALASNTPEQCDSAALRAGRIDQKYIFELPTVAEREIAYQRAVDRVCGVAGYKVVRGAPIDALAKASKGFSYADIQQSVDEAVRTRAKEVILDKTPGIIPAAYVSGKRMLVALEQHRDKFVKKEAGAIGFK